MTAILNEIRALEAARDRGDLDDRTFASAKQQLLDDIEDATTDENPDSIARPVFAALAAFAAGTLVGTLLFGDVLLAATASTMIMAAFIIRAFRRL